MSTEFIRSHKQQTISLTKTKPTSISQTTAAVINTFTIECTYNFCTSHRRHLPHNNHMTINDCSRPENNPAVVQFGTKWYNGTRLNAASDSFVRPFVYADSPGFLCLQEYFGEQLSSRCLALCWFVWFDIDIHQSVLQKTSSFVFKGF